MAAAANSAEGGPAPDEQVWAELGIGLPGGLRVRASDGLMFYGIPVFDGVQERTWHALRAAHGETGLWPFVSELNPREWNNHRERCRMAEWITQQEARDPVIADLLQARQAADRVPIIATGDGGESRAELDRWSADRLVRCLGFGRLPSNTQPGLYGYSASSPLWVCLLRATAGGHTIPAQLCAPYTPNWLASPTHRYLTPNDHSAVLHEWFERFGAELAYLGPKSLDLWVSHPPDKPRDVAEVALEQYAYCNSLDETIGEVEQVARLQVPSKRWAFWWD